MMKDIGSHTQITGVLVVSNDTKVIFSTKIQVSYVFRLLVVFD